MLRDIRYCLTASLITHTHTSVVSDVTVALPEYFTVALSLLNLLENTVVWAVLNPQLDSCKPINTLCGIFLIYPSLTELPSLETKRALQDVSELGYLLLDKSSLHIVA